MTKVPNSRRNLDDAIRRVAGFDAGYVRARTVIANAIVGQMLPDGVVKGGSALKLRFGDAGTRFTADLDVARGSALADYVGKLDERLAEGWCGFTGKLVECRPAKPKGVPSHYVMQPFDVKLSYLGKSWLTVSLEIGHDEIGDADEVEMGLAPDVARRTLREGGPAAARSRATHALAPSGCPKVPCPHRIGERTRPRPCGPADHHCKHTPRPCQDQRDVQETFLVQARPTLAFEGCQRRRMGWTVLRAG